MTRKKSMEAEGTVDYCGTVVRCECGTEHDVYCNICQEATLECRICHGENQTHGHLAEHRSRVFLENESKRLTKEGRRR